MKKSNSNIEKAGFYVMSFGLFAITLTFLFEFLMDKNIYYFSAMVFSGFTFKKYFIDRDKKSMNKFFDNMPF